MKSFAFLTFVAGCMVAGCVPIGGDGPLVVPVDAVPTPDAARDGGGDASAVEGDAGADAAGDAGADAALEPPLEGVLVDIRSVAPCNCDHAANCVQACPPADDLPAPLADYDRRFFEVRFYPVAAGPSRPLGLPADHDVTETGPALAGACRDDRLFVHFPALDFPTQPDFPLAAFRELLSTRLQAWWFEAEDAPDPRPERARRWLRLNPAGRCAAVQAVRAAAHALVPNARVGRVCEFAPQLVPEVFAGPAVDWHLRRLDARLPPHGGNPADPLSFPAELPAGGAVDLLLFDAGWSAAGPLGVRTRAVDPFEATPQAPPGRHGDQMAALIRQVVGAPVTIAGWRVLDEHGRGTTHDLAAALADALHVQDRPHPAVINLSLGWPAGLNNERLVWTATADPGSPYACGQPEPGEGAVLEDAAGEAVRHFLAQAQAREIAVFASAGNRPGRAAFQRATPVDEYGVPGVLSDACLAKRPNPTPWFFPAEWAFTPGTCTLGDGTVGAKRYPVVAVSATDGRDGPARGTLHETPLVAPGEAVDASLDAPTEPTPAVAPTALTGSSVAAALTSAVAARLQALRRGTGQSPLSARTLARLLWLTAEPTGRTARGGASESTVRRLSLCRAEVALACAVADAAVCPGGSPVACLEQDALSVFENTFASAVLDGRGPFPGCRRCLDACLAAAPTCAGEPVVPEPAQAGFDVLEACGPGACPLDFGGAVAVGEAVLEAPADAPLLPFEADGDRLLDAYELGGLGPQPILPPCPDCQLKIVFPGGAGTLHARLDPALFGTDPLRPQATLVSAHLVVQRTNSLAFVPVYGPTTTPTWVPGQYYSVTGLAFGTALARPADWVGAKVVLVSKVRIEQGKTAGTTYVDESVISHKVVEF